MDMLLVLFVCTRVIRDGTPQPISTSRPLCTGAAVYILFRTYSFVFFHRDAFFVSVACVVTIGYTSRFQGNELLIM